MELFDQLNWVDLVLSLALIATLFIGFGLGFYRQIALAVGLLIGLAIAGQFTDALSASSLFATPREKLGGGGARMLAYLGLLGLPVMASLASFFVFPKIFGKTIRFVDTILGGATGVACAVILFWICVVGSAQFEKSWLETPVRDSYLGSRLAQGACYLSQMFPEEFRVRVEDGFRARIDPFLEREQPEAENG